jgi:hypothetical protein
MFKDIVNKMNLLLPDWLVAHAYIIEAAVLASAGYFHLNGEKKG